MKIIHTADIHLDSPLSQVKNPQMRRLELLQALANLTEYANNNDVSAVIVAGDLFDDLYATETTIRGVADIIAHSNATWFVLEGNHGKGIRGEQGKPSPYDKLKSICLQVKAFGNDWTNYALDGVNICGRELGFDDKSYWQNLSLPADCFNILVLHGDVDDDGYGLIDKKAIANSGANYLALGHRHTFATYKFGKTNACYCGVLECRGFDESEQTGFVVIDTQTNKAKFVPQAIRQVCNVSVDVSGVQSEIALQNALLQAVAQVSARNYLNLVLTGSLDERLNLKNVIQLLADKFFALRVENKTQPTYDLDTLSQEVSLRGEFVRKVLQLPEDDRAEILQLGLTLLNGGELQ